MNLVEITVKTNDEVTSSLKNIEKTAKQSGGAAGKPRRLNNSTPIGSW